MTHENIIKWLELSRQATEGPWTVDFGDPRNPDDVYGINSGSQEVIITDSGVYPPNKETSMFIAASRNITSDVEKLLQECEDYCDALMDIRTHGCCVMHNDNRCPGCRSIEVLKKWKAE